MRFHKWLIVEQVNKKTSKKHNGLWHLFYYKREKLHRPVGHIAQAVFVEVVASILRPVVSCVLVVLSRSIGAYVKGIVYKIVLGNNVVSTAPEYS